MNSNIETIKKFYQWEPLDSFPDYTFDYDVDYDYDCLNEGCDDPGSFCRCGRIINVKMNIDLDSLLRLILSSKSSEELVGPFKYDKLIKEQEKNFVFFEYCLDRLIRIYKLYDSQSWYYNIQNGYYGQEVNDFRVNDSQFKKDLVELFNLEPNKKIEFVLLKEYGHLLDSIKDKKWIEKTVPFEKLFLPNMSYFKKIPDNIYGQEKLANILHKGLGIYQPQGEKYRLIDGYHRYLKLKNEDYRDSVKIFTYE